MEYKVRYGLESEENMFSELKETARSMGELIKKVWVTRSPEADQKEG